jgi:carbon-monoxide dehydrogenase medium subunit
VYVPDVELHQAATLDEAATLLARYGPTARLLAGGTDLLVDLKTGRVSARHLVSLKRIDGLRGISKTGAELRIGALTTIAEIERSALVREEYPAILDAASQMAARQIRNMATTGGNIACGVPCADLPPILTAMNASLALWSPGGEREVRLETFHTGARETVLRSNEVLTAIRVPQPPARFGAAYARFAQRDGNAIAVFRAAAAAARAAAEPITDVRGSADFRRELVEVLTRRALERALERAMGAAS